MEMGKQGASFDGVTTTFVCSTWFFRLFCVYFLIIIHPKAATASTDDDDDDDELYVYVNIMWRSW